MHNFGFLKVASAIPATSVANPAFNATEMQRMIDEAYKSEVSIVCFPELSITGYSCGDLFSQQQLQAAAENALATMLSNNKGRDIIYIVGMPVATPALLLNTAVVCQGNTILGVVPKTYLPGYHEFYEQRWFASATTAKDNHQVTLCGQQVPLSANTIFRTSQGSFAIEICEDLWGPIPPSSRHVLYGADIIFNLSATNELIGKNQYLHTLITQQSARTISGYVYASCGFGESTQDLVYGGNALIFENGKSLAESRRFDLEPQLVISDIDVEHLRHERRVNTTFAGTVAHETNKNDYIFIDVPSLTLHASRFTLHREINPHPFVPKGKTLNERCEEIFNIQSSALAKRIVHTHARSLVIGISGGLDSTLALLVCIKAIDMLKRPRTDIVGITMPGFGTTDRTYNNALALMKSLGITIREISIRESVMQHFRDIGHDPAVHDVTYENSQARERTQILMDVANQTGGFVVGTGDLSELALGWCTYNADHMSNYGVNCSVPKTLVRHLVSWVAHGSLLDATSCTTLLDIVDTPISPELLPADAEGNIQQKTEDLVGPYELHDFFLYNFMRNGFAPSKILFLAKIAFEGSYDEATISHWLKTFIRRFFSQQFKRSCLPDGPKVGSVSLSPRGDWRMPSDASSEAFL